MEVSGQGHTPPLYSRGRDPVPIVEEACWTPEPFWTSVEKRKIFAPHWGLYPGPSSL